MVESAQYLVYLLSAALFVWGLRRLGSPATARSGNALAALAMLLAVVVTLLDRGIVSWTGIAGGLLAGAIIGALLARTVKMTAMPELVGVFNGLGGGASALVASAEFFRTFQFTWEIEMIGESALLVAARAMGGGPGLGAPGAASVALGVLVGTVTLSGSFIAFGKLKGFLPGRPVVWPLQKTLNLILFLSAVGISAVLAAGAGGVIDLGAPTVLLAALAGIALLLGIFLVLPIGGADMPVVISLLNSYSGLAASAAGFVVGNPLLIIAGALVGASGLILTQLMCRAMNRSLANVAFGAFGGTGVQAGADTGDRPVRRTTPEEAALLLAYAQSVIIVPGYGLAVAQAQHEVRKLMDLLQARDVQVRFAIHPVAGRMPGHMNVLLAEADIPYDLLVDMDDANPEFPRTDVVVVVGANDVVNPVARDPGSPIAGMPILDVDRARSVVVIKRSLSPGFAGIDNPLFYNENTFMLFMDAKEAVSSLAREVKEA
ncbi:MAG: NAD(P)(+) transhydrogenase (Re/Si-specific) subunit beta [Gemmatimonadales bacterium]|nr:MAG: NAD(P)(+) transhydrogenase (Re/Si-specific) subunit beta [Gemmatimonadales bacterium]